MKKLLIFFSIFFLLFFLYYFIGEKEKTSYTFYHWKSTYGVEVIEKNPPKYVKVLDISYAETFTLRKTIFKSKAPKNMVPVVYLDNPLWTKMKVKTMVTKVLTALDAMSLSAYDEIQVDCDWTDESREPYFEFLKLLKEESFKKISVTIRLHQVKYHKKTGVPPMDYGVLMYYNMSNFRDMKTRNYILDLDLAKQYHYNFDTYPLALNLALPLYAQATIIRFSKVVGLMEGVRKEMLNEHFKKLKEHLFEVQKTHYFRGRLLYEGDKIRVDEVSVDVLKKSIESLKEVMNQPKEVIFYRWGNRAFYGDDILEKVVDKW